MPGLFPKPTAPPMTRSDLHDYVDMLDGGVQEVFAKIEMLAANRPDTSFEYEILAKLFGVFDAFAQRWHDSQQESDNA